MQYQGSIPILAYPDPFAPIALSHACCCSYYTLVMGCHMPVHFAWLCGGVSLMVFIRAGSTVNPAGVLLAGRRGVPCHERPRHNNQCHRRDLVRCCACTSYLNSNAVLFQQWQGIPSYGSNERGCCAYCCPQHVQQPLRLLPRTVLCIDVYTCMPYGPRLWVATPVIIITHAEREYKLSQGWQPIA